MEARHPSALDDFFFDLRGYLVLKQAAEPELIDDLNRVIDELPPLEYGQWYGNAQRRDYTSSTGLELHNCAEAGEPFERLIDHPGWINYVRRYCGDPRQPQIHFSASQRRRLRQARPHGSSRRRYPAVYGEGRRAAVCRR